MIRFACPGCNATYTVDDSKGGKAGKCPKCQAQFVIPAAEAAAVVPPPPSPPRLPPPPPAPAADAPVEIKPCPKCGARLSVAASDLGVDVECPYCQAVYTAKRAGAADPPAERPSRRREEPSSEGPARRSRRDDDADERPSRRRPAADRDDDEDDDRPRRRRRDEDDEEDDDRPRRKKKKRRGRSSEVDTVARLNYILGGLAMVCGFCIVGVGGAAGAALGAAAKNQPGKAPPIDPGTLTTIMLAVGGVQILFSIVMIVAGIGVSKRQNWGRVMTLGTGGLGCLFGLLYLANIVMSLIGGNIPGAVGALIGAGIWGGYGITALRTMLSHGDEFE